MGSANIGANGLGLCDGGELEGTNVQLKTRNDD
jgi:hypothetical protein